MKKFQKLPKQMRDLFIISLSEADLCDPKELFEQYHESMSEDYAHQLLPPDDTNSELLRWMLLIDIQERLQGIGKELSFNELGEITEDIILKVAAAKRQHNLFHECREIREEISYDRHEIDGLFQRALNGEGLEKRGQMTESKKSVFNAVKTAINGTNLQICIFINV